MTRHASRFASLLLALFSIAAAAAAPAPDETAYLADISKRADKIVATLNVGDEAKSKQVHGILVEQYKGLRSLHDARKEKLAAAGEDKAAAEKIKADTAGEVKTLHDGFLANLITAGLSAQQVDKVKDGLTYNKVHVDYNAFCDMLPNLTDEQKGYIKAQLVEARELAMDGGSSEEKQNIFGKYRGRINNYLSKQGYDLKQASKDWAERRKAREAADKQQPAANN
jgi:hypothetical protein